VIGVVAEANARFWKASFDATNLPATPYSWEASSKWDAGLRVRVGTLAQDNLLLYATGGVAVASFDLNNTVYVNQSMWGNRNVLGGTNVGWSSGVGTEYRLNSLWSAQIEYLHSDFGNKTVYGDSGEKLATPKLLSNSIKVGVNYRF